ncbi:MalY/PatB family protein [Shouchella shacheensis]|uniref:MalY/PatB family protein n=1 Tax=Shouchella shacheensis TaxID=1649580 RepID=UPI002480727C|nr:MalY/PatB family protein [Shouchella shacheensis]
MKRFDEVIERRGTNSMKWDATKERFGEEDLLPLWVADMDFRAPEPVIEALKEKVEHGIYGYPSHATGVDEAIVDWAWDRYSWEVSEKAIVHTTGVVPALSNIIKAFTEPGDEVIIQTPVYYPFYDVIQKSNRTVIKNPLHFTGEQYEMDLEQLEEAITEDTKMLILCHPHNPGGRVWSKEELAALAAVCEKHQLYVISDEIHADLLYDGYSHTSFASVNEQMAKRTFTTLAPTKTFNLAGIQAAYIIVENPELRLKLRRDLAGTFMNGPNMFSEVATEAAYRHGGEWLKQLMSYIQTNYEVTRDFLEDHMPKIKVVKPQGTYLLWLNCEELGLSANERKEWLIKEAKVALNHGPIFGEEAEHFERLNLASPRKTLMEGLNRIKAAYEKRGF